MAHHLFGRALRANKSLLLFVFLFYVLLNFRAEGKTLRYFDKLGRRVELSVPVKRAVIVSGCEILPAFNPWDKIVGISRWAYNDELTKESIQKGGRKIPTVGTGSDVNIEALIKRKPDVVVIWTYKPELIRLMEERGLKVIGIYPESLEELFNLISLFGRLFGEEARAKEITHMMRKIFELIKEKTNSIPKGDRKKVLWLWGSPTRVAGGKSVEGSLIEKMNAINPASSYKVTGVDVSLEKIIEWNPDVIFIWGYAKYSVKDIVDNPQWRTIKAVRAKCVYKAPNWSTWSPRIALIALWMASKVYPEKFPSSMLKKNYQDFYRKVFLTKDGSLKGLE